VSQVIIVGAGPAGAALALLFAQRGIDVTLLERHTDFAREFRGEVLLPGGLEALDQMGVWEPFETIDQVTPGALEMYVNGRRRARVAFDLATFGKFSPRWVSQPALLEMLVARASAFPNFRIERGATVRSLPQQGGRHVGVRALTAGGEREFGGDLVIGADGRSSVVRRRAELPERQDPTPMDVVWCKVPLPEYARVDKPFRGYLGHGHLLLAAPVYDGMLQVAWVIRKGAFGELRERGMAACIAEMAKHVSPDLADHLRRHAHDVSHPFLLSVVSDRVLEWSRPGLLVIGDAAHTMSPVGAQGINIALRDAIVAANHLVPALCNGAEPAAIDAAARAVQAEREPEVIEIQRIQAGPPRVILRDTWWAQLALQFLPMLLSTDIARARRGVLFRRFAFGITEVKLVV
jgi:2-polyprenyl-6-methoxyphenol hydroxylase-like FAD-dependent oxidoreductase